MRATTIRIFAVAVMGLLAPLASAQSAFTVTPAAPGPLDFIEVHKPYGNENPAATTVSMTGNRITVRLTNYFMYFPEPSPVEVEADIGRLPAGDYQVEVILNDPYRGTTTSLGVSPFKVTPRVAGQPVDDYSDIWWNPNESGWGLNVAQHASGQLFATWFVYAPDGAAQWYVLPGGAWHGPNFFEGDVYRTTGPDMAHFTASAVTRTKAGTATLIFGPAGLYADFTVDGTTYHKQLQRQPF